MRPCSGAILVLVFALAQGLFWAGIAATFVMGLGTAITVATIAVIAVSAKDLARRLSAGREGGGALIMRGIEFGAAGLVLLFGVGLLFGYLAAERVTCLTCSSACKLPLRAMGLTASADANPGESAQVDEGGPAISADAKDRGEAVKPLCRRRRPMASGWRRAAHRGEHHDGDQTRHRGAAAPGWRRFPKSRPAGGSR